METNAPINEAPKSLKLRIQAFKEKHDKFLSPAFFVAGFLFDVLMVGRVDEAFSLIQQVFYLLFILVILFYRTLESFELWRPSPKFERIWHYNDEALHFVLGTLLNIYTIFYFVSSSLATSFLFVAIIFGLIVANELPGLKKSGLSLKYGLFSVCLFSFFFIIVAIGLGYIGVVSFLLGLALGLAAFYGFFDLLKKQIAKRSAVAQPTQADGSIKPTLDLKKIVLAAPMAVAVSLVALYTLKLLPPIPLSIQYMGIYHEVEKVRSPEGGETKYLLKYDRPSWKFWQHGAQSFLAEPGDKINCFIRIFAPSNFHDEIVYSWFLKDSRGYWQPQDHISNKISGGREEGFRGLAVKSNFVAGDWRVQVETTDGREIGRIDFAVALEPNKNLVREFKVDEL